MKIAFILPSLWEELGLAIVQAAMSNTVIISSDCPNGPKEFLNNGQSGILFRNNYEGALCNSLVYFVKNENLLNFNFKNHFRIFVRTIFFLKFRNR